MPHASLRFNLPEENSEFQLAVDAGKWKSVCEEMDRILRDKVKYGIRDEDPMFGTLTKENREIIEDALDRVRKFMFEECASLGIDIYDDN